MTGDYGKAGVDVDENDLANSIAKKLAPLTFNSNVLTNMEGLFSAGYKINRDNGLFIGQKIVSGSKEELKEKISSAIKSIKESGDKPLFLVDYLGFGKLKATDAAKIILEVMEGSRLDDGSFIPLIGGEIAEMPGVIKEGESEILVTITYQSKEKKDSLVDLSNFQGDIITASIDSVGTKTKLGLDLGIMDGLFNDMIGHSVGDVSMQGPIPAGISMYVGCSHELSWDMDPVYNKSVESSKLVNLNFVKHAKDVYHTKQFDIVGGIIGVVDGNKLLAGKNIEEGDFIIGKKSFGVNTNGYSLIRKLGDEGKIKYDDEIAGMKVGEALMKPHEDYRQALQTAHETFKDSLKGAAHITGGGIESNTKRLLPDGLKVMVEKLPDNALFNYIQEKGSISEEDMNKTFNRGVGVTFIVSKDFDVSKLPEDFMVIGEVVPNS